MTNQDDGDRSRRQIAKRARRVAGDRSARVAHTLMKLPEASLGKLGLDQELRDVIDRARRVTQQVARRRAERTVAGELRRVDLRAIETRIAQVAATGVAEPQLFHSAEHWRTRLIEEGSAAAEAFPGGNVAPLPGLIHQARRERDTGKPPGAARALFRHVLDVLRAQAAAPAPAAADEDDDEDDDDDEDEADDVAVDDEDDDDDDDDDE